MFEILPHFHILQIQLSEFFFIFLYELCDLIEFPEGKKKKKNDFIQYKNNASGAWLNKST